jgi:hypothetical protein
VMPIHIPRTEPFRLRCPGISLVGGWSTLLPGRTLICGEDAARRTRRTNNKANEGYTSATL